MKELLNEPVPMDCVSELPIAQAGGKRAIGEDQRARVNGAADIEHIQDARHRFGHALNQTLTFGEGGALALRASDTSSQMTST